MAFRAALRPLTGTGSLVAGLGCAPLGNLFAPLAEDDADATVAHALARGIRFFDTAPHYGAGVSEVRLGRAHAAVPRDDVVIATKVGRRIVDAAGAPVASGGTGVDTVGDLSRDGVLRSVEGSLARLGTDRIDLLYLHDPADVDEALAGAMPALVRLRDEGVVRAIGVGMVHAAPLARFAREADVDVIMPALRLTLLDRSAEGDLLPAAHDRGIGIVAAGVYNSGILADPVASPVVDYRPATSAQLERALAFDAICRAHDVPLATAAVRFPLRYPDVEAVVVGARSPGEVDAFVDALGADIPNSLWSQLEAARA